MQHSRWTFGLVQN